jgi:hypothetical protein
MKLTIGQRVRIKDDAWEFGGVVGTIDFAPNFVAELETDPWIGPFKHEKRKHGTALVYWVRFDKPADDGSGDGPYSAAGIDACDLEPIVEG